MHKSIVLKLFLIEPDIDKIITNKSRACNSRRRPNASDVTTWPEVNTAKNIANIEIEPMERLGFFR